MLYLFGKGSDSLNTRLRIKNMTYIALGAVILTVCSWISIPTPVIPFTLQTFGVYLLVYLFGAKKALMSLLVYVALGLIGVPVFSSFRSGDALFGATGGYIVGFIISVNVCIAAGTIFTKKKSIRLIVSFLSLAACYAVGSAWALFVTELPNSYFEVLAGSVLTFGIFDCIKIFLADTLSAYLKKIISISA